MTSERNVQDRHYNFEECTWTDITIWRNVHGQTSQFGGMYMDGHYKLEECTWTDITSERNVQGTDITSERNVQGTDITSLM